MWTVGYRINVARVFGLACDVYTWCAVLLATPFRMPLFLFIAVLSQQNIQEPTHTNTERKRKAHKATHLTQGQCILAIHFDSIWIFISLQFSSNQCRLCCNTDREKDHESCKSRCKGMKYLHAGLFCFFSGVVLFHRCCIVIEWEWQSFVDFCWLYAGNRTLARRS